MLVDKPKGWTSFDVVNKLRYKVRHRHGTKKFKVGHAGTLDPMATGLLLIAIGKYTKLIEQLQGLGKSYAATIKLGATTPSYDAEEAEDAQYPTAHITPQLAESTLEQYRGDIMQAPPMFSALKVDGVRLYKKARKGQTVEIAKRPVTISELTLNRFELPEMDITCSVSKGTYIRSLAHDIGRSLDSGGYLTALRAVDRACGVEWSFVGVTTIAIYYFPSPLSLMQMNGLQSLRSDFCMVSISFTD